MDYQFSFNDKQELIFLNNQPYINEIGSLLMALLDTEWDVSLVQTEFKTHPTISYYLSKADNVEELKEKIYKLALTRDLAISLFEAFVDEQRELYREKFEEFENENEHLKKYYLIEEAVLMPIEKRSKKIYNTMTDEFPYLFETNDFFTIIHHEFNFMFTSKFIVRRCAYCGKFFFTRKTNQTYCKRKVTYLNKTCSQLGPVKQWQSRRAAPYKLYWNYRMRLFNRNSCDARFDEWVDKTNQYKELAKTNNITMNELEQVLSIAENEVYGM